MEWVAIDIGIAGDPAVHRMAAALKVRVPEVVGLLTLAFGGMAKHAEDGNVGGVPDTLLETWATWHGKRGVFAAQFRAELCDESGVVRAWEHYNGRAIRRANAASERTRKWRETHTTSAPQNAPPNAHSTHNRTHTECATVCGTVQDSTVPNQEPPVPSGTKGVDYSPEFEAVWSIYPRRAGGNSKKDAYAAWRARLRSGVPAAVLHAGVERYAAWLASEGKVGTQFVKLAASFFGTGDHYLETWAITSQQPAVIQTRPRVLSATEMLIS